MPRRHRKMRGGFLDSLTQGISDAWSKTKTAASGAYSSVSGEGTSTTSTYTPPTTSTTTYTPPTTSTTTSTTTTGGRKRTRKHRKMRGGYSDNTSLTGLAASASPISDIKTAQPHNWVGGKSKRRHNRRSRRH